MKTSNKLKIFNDPIYGFITIPNSLIFDVIQHQDFQRLRRISQMGMSYLVYPGAHHTRFHHALGCMHLMSKAISVLRFKKINITDEEETALYLAILLHDIGHGPFSHALEHSIVNGITHEEISLIFMKQLNKKFNNQFDLAIQIFKGDYHRPFLCQLISGQFDMDRADYLKRDSFYTGVAEGNVNSERLITMLNVVENRLVVEEKGIYSVEKFLMARRLMYWQVYLHKTSLVAEELLIKVFKRAKFLASQNIEVNCSKPLSFFLYNEIGANNFNEMVLKKFSLLDDYDVVSAMKLWVDHEDFVLSRLSKMIINRDLLKIKIKNDPIDDESFNDKLKSLCLKNNLSDEEASYFVFKGNISNQIYQLKKQKINILHKNGKVKDLGSSSDQFNSMVNNKPVVKYFICYPKGSL